MTRTVPVAVLLVVLAVSGVARAQGTGSGPLPNNAAIVFERRQIYDESKNDGSFFEPQAATPELLHYFNLAHCNCARTLVTVKPDGTLLDGPLKVMPNKLGTFNYLVHEIPASNLHVGVDFFAGTSCDDPAHRNPSGSPTCTTSPIDSVTDLDADLNTTGGSYRNFNLFQVVNANQDRKPGPMAGTNVLADCLQLDNVSNSLFALVDTTGGTTYNYSASQPAGALSGETGTASGVDTRPPPLPTAIKAAGGDHSIHLTWTPPMSNNTDVAFYQALCATLPSADTPDGNPATLSPSNDPQYVTSASLCGAAGDPTVDPVDVSNPAADKEQSVAAPTGEFAALNEDYICGEADSGTANSLDIIGGLKNHIPYRVILLSVDRHGNYRAAYLTSTVTPIPSRDFWQDLHDRGSHTEGGLCLLAETYGNDSALTGALRAFRDDTLGASRAGRWLTAAYYATLARLGARVHGSGAWRFTAAIALAPVVALALLWHWLTLYGLLGLLAAAVVWRRWRTVLGRRVARLLRPRAAAATAALMIALVAGRAHAGGGAYQPYWENSDSFDKTRTAADAGTGDITWHVGVRIGPYVPDIDGQLGGPKPGPYEQMFGGYHILTMLDVDRILWSGFGQVGVSLSAGYWQKTARAFTIESKPMDSMRARAGDHNAFRLVPTELSATYRFTWLDDNYGVPIVPYARGGLGYYIWWVSVADHYAHACANPTASVFCNDGMSHNDKALGASLGVQGAIGVAIRAERVDAATAMSMQQSGIQHAGIYAELSLAKVDGFGSDKKLSVGDATWFAGVDFEF